MVAGGPLGECPLGVLDGGPLGVPAGGPAGTVDEDPVGAPEGRPEVPVGTPVPEDAADGLGVVVVVGGGDTLEQNWATVSFRALAAAVSCGKLFWGLLEVPLVLVPLSAAAQAVHCPKALELGADPLPFWPLAWLFDVAAPPGVD